MAREGTYKEWISGKGLETVCKWAKLGLSDKQIAHNMGLKSVSTYYAWKKRFKEFSDAIKKAKTIPNLELENSMFDLATGNCYEEITRTILDVKTRQPVRIEKITRKVPPNPTMQIFLAKNRMPEKYKDRPVEQTDAYGNESDTVVYLPEKDPKE